MQSSGTSKASLWAGRILSALPILLFVVSAAFGILKPAAASEGFAHYGYPAGAMLRITIVELVCALIYAIPQTSILGAILLTGYLGGAVATHVRVGENFSPALVVGIMVWAGLFLRDERLRNLIPLRKRGTGSSLTLPQDSMGKC